MAASQSDEITFDALDALLAQADAIDKEMRVAYPELYAQAAQAEDAAPSAPAFPAPQSAGNYDDDFVQTPAQKSTQFSALPLEDYFEDEPEEMDEDSLQAYFLRRKFEEQPSVSAWERADAEETISRLSDDPAHLPDDELFLYALTKLCAGVNDEASRAIALMDQRPGINPLLSFLPVYTAPELGASRGRISDLVHKRTSDTDESMERAMVIFSQKMLIDLIDIITEAEALQEAGYRNRQEALSQAAQNVRRRLSRLNY